MSTPRTHTLLHRLGVALAVGASAVLVLGSTGCQKQQRPRARAVATPVVRDLPAILRNNIGAQATLRGVESQLVSGYGIVVGLQGTGTTDLPLPVQAMMEREMGLRGVGAESLGMGWTSPREMLADPNTAVVVVQGIIEPGAPAGARFDVLVNVLPGTSATSLEGGKLWTTDLEPGLPVPGGPVAATMARASGDVFINPFADPAAEGQDAIVRTTGRILNGGVVVQGRQLILSLDTPSHSRARSIVAAINSAFPQLPPDRDPTARGRNEELIEVNVPARYRERTREFVQLMLHTRVEPSFPQDWAVRYVRALQAEPELAEDISWCLEALGNAAIPAMRDLYGYPEAVPRLAALRAGARLGDALVTPHLKELAVSGPPSLRADAINLLGLMPPDPQVNLALRELVSAPELDVRLAAYEALAKRGDPSIESIAIENKFRLDSIPSSEPMIYVSQQGQPRIVLLGGDMQLDRPTFVSGWSDRLMLVSDSPTDSLRVYYRDHRSGRSTTAEVAPSLTEFIEFLAHTSTPEAPAPGLGLSYSEVVGALYEIWKADGMPAGFVAEQDRLASELLRTFSATRVEDRPETEADRAAQESFFAPPPGAQPDAQPSPPPPDDGAAAGAREEGAPGS